MARSLKNENLIELNLSALEAVFEALDKDHFKDLIGNLNWNKFAERIASQLQTNQNLTAEQKRLIEVNLVVALIKSNQIDQARKEWQKLSKKNDHPSLKGIGAFFAMRDKKWEEALASVTGKDSYSTFLRAQIYIAKSKIEDCFIYFNQRIARLHSSFQYPL